MNKEVLEEKNYGLINKISDITALYLGTLQTLDVLQNTQEKIKITIIKSGLEIKEWK